MSTNLHLVDADLAATSDLARHYRARATVADAEIDAAYAEREHNAALDVLIGRWQAAGGDELAQLRVAADAQRYDHKHGTSLRDQLLSIAADEFRAVA